MPGLVRCLMPIMAADELTLTSLCSPVGYGVYESEEACVGNAAFIEATGIDPATYPAPEVAPTSCPAKSGPGGQVSMGHIGTGCCVASCYIACQQACICNLR